MIFFFVCEWVELGDLLLYGVLYDIGDGMIL